MKRTVILFCLTLFLLPLSANASLVPRSSGTLKINSSQLANAEPGLLGLWTFDGPDISTTAVNDKSGSAFTGTPNSFTNIAKNLIPGKKAQALAFDGSDDNVSMGDVAESGTITLTAWVKPATVKTGMKIVSKKMSGASSQYGLATSNSTADKFTAVFFSSAPSSDVCESTGTDGSYTAGKWYFVAATYDADSCKIYVNAVDVTTVAQDLANGNILNTTSALRIGADGGASIAAGSYFAGAIDDVRIYNYALTAEQIRMMYEASAGLVLSGSKNDRLTSGLVGLWSFDGPTMFANVADGSGQGNHGSMLNFGATSTVVKPGRIGQGLFFDGNDDRVETVNTVMGTGAATFSAWIFPKSFGENELGEIVTSGQTRLRVNSSSSRFSFTSDNFTSHADSANNSVVLNRWTLITVTRAADGTANIYINGELSGSADQSSGTPGASANPTEIGNNLTGAVTFYGIIDDVRIYNRVLSVSEVKALYNLGR